MERKREVFRNLAGRPRPTADDLSVEIAASKPGMLRESL
jgi:hypothetical protein